MSGINIKENWYVLLCGRQKMSILTQLQSSNNTTWDISEQSWRINPPKWLKPAFPNQVIKMQNRSHYFLTWLPKIMINEYLTGENWKCICGGRVYQLFLSKLWYTSCICFGASVQVCVWLKFSPSWLISKLLCIPRKPGQEEETGGDLIFKK